MKLDLPNKVTVVEVGARDGLQNETKSLSVNDKVSLVNGLSETGLQHIEVGSFVSPKWVPQMANSDEVFNAIKRNPNITYSALTPNMRGYESAKSCHVDTVAVFASASESFSQKNINCDIKTSIDRFAPLLVQAKHDGVNVRAYVSCVLGCPYEGDVDPSAVLELTQTLLDMGCYEVSLGDTIGVGTAFSTNKLLNLLISRISVHKLALHCHDTYGQGLANILIGLQQGIHCFDSSVAGLGGCPYASGASGNLASEDLVYMLNQMEISTGIDLHQLSIVGEKICQVLGRTNQSKAGRALTVK